MCGYVKRGGLLPIFCQAEARITVTPKAWHDVGRFRIKITAFGFG